MQQSTRALCILLLLFVSSVVHSNAGSPDGVLSQELAPLEVAPVEAVVVSPEEQDDDAVRAAHHSGGSGSSSWNTWVWHNGWYKSLNRAAQVASRLPQMTTLIAAVTAAGVAGPLGDSSTQWTILAPTNDAFEDLLEALGMTAAQLLADKALLQKVLSYHVVPAAALNSRQLQNQAYSTALQGQRVTIKRRSSGSVRITGGAAGNRANVVVPNIRAGNSMIHVIDTVLLPAA